MEGAIKGLFGGDDDEQQRGQAEDFISRYDDGDPSQGYSRDEAQEQFARVQKQATPEQMQHAAQQAIQRMPADQRAELNEMLRQRQMGQGGVDIQRSGDQPGTGGGGGGLDDLLGGLMGGGGGTGGSSGGGGGIGDILGGLLGGGGQSGSRGQSGSSSGGMGGIGDLMSSPAGKALIGGIAAFAMKEMMGRRR